MEELQLIVSIDGSIQESNFGEYKSAWIAQLKQVNLNPQTDNELAEAEVFVKDCKAAEGAISEARDKAMSGTADIATLMTDMEEVRERLRAVRLPVSKAVKSAKDQKKLDAINNAYDKIGLYIDSIYSDENLKFLKGKFSINRDSLNDAVKGKRTMESIENALEVDAELQIEEVSELVEIGRENNEAITGGDESHMHLFPDFKSLVLHPVVEVAALLAARLAEYKLKLERDKAEKLELDRLALEKKAADKKLADKRAALEATTTPAPICTTTMQPVQVPAMVKPKERRSTWREPEQQEPVEPTKAVDVGENFIMTISFTFRSRSLSSGINVNICLEANPM